MSADLFIDRSNFRTRIVKELGYVSYQKYLESELWERIKRNAVVVVGGYCVVCNAWHETFHHTAYSRAVLSGRSLVSLRPICHRCHGLIHFKNQRKLTLAETNKRLAKLRLKTARMNPAIAKELDA